MTSAFGPASEEPCHSGTHSFVEKIGRPMEIVNGKTEEEVTNVLKESDENIQVAAAQLLGSDDSTVLEKKEETYSTLSELVEERISKQMLSDEDLTWSVKREEIWRCALTFYKTAQVNPQRLKKNLIIEFDGDQGLDGGALKKEFFSLLFKDVDWRMFEGAKDHRIPRKGCDNIGLFKLAGTMLSHAVMQDCPNLLQFPAWLFDLLVSGDPSVVTETISIQDMPKTSASENLICLIQKLDSAANDEEINKILGNDVYFEIINQSQWPTAKVINTNTRHMLAQQLILNDVVFQRMPQILALRDGLQSLGVLDMLMQYPQQCRQLLVFREETLTPSQFINDILTKASQLDPEDPVKKAAHQFFMQYISASCEDKKKEFPEGRLKLLLQFATGQASVTGISYVQVELAYLEDEEAKTLPEATACAGKLHLPTVHSTYQSFEASMDTALKYGAYGFGTYT